MSGRKLFGTDGIRGRANIYPMTGDLAFALGRAVTYYFQNQLRSDQTPLIVLGKDTRLSCYMLELAFCAGVCAQGGKVALTGPLPTPGVAFATKSMRAHAGVMISASHNSYHDNGIKLFDSMGYKLPDTVELELERLVLNQDLIPMQNGDKLGRAQRLDEVFGRYIVHVKSGLPQDFSLEGMRIVVDCAHGAAYKVAPKILTELGAEVVALSCSPNGKNINEDCGSLHPHLTCETVTRYRADLGICLDGDADRVILSSHRGEEINGDKILGVMARYLLAKKVLKTGDSIVGTVMTNFGLEHYLNSLGLQLIRAKVGDRYIMEIMKEKDLILGGEPSGHIIHRPYATTGDGLVAALLAISAMKTFEKTLEDLALEVPLYPQIMQNVRVKYKRPLEQESGILDVLKMKEEEMKGRGRIVLRYSGTEDLLRVMVEAETEKMAQKVCDDLVQVVTQTLDH